MAAQVGSPALADASGNFYFAGLTVNAVDPNGNLRWKYPLGKNLDMGTETVYASRMLLSPDGGLYVSASDGFLHVINSADGKGRFKKELATSQSYRAPLLTAGIGDTFFLWAGTSNTGSAPYDAVTGQAFAAPTVDGKPVTIFGATFDGLLADSAEIIGDRSELHTHFLNPCMEVVWSLPKASGSWYVALVRHDNTLVVANYPGNWVADQAFAYLYSAEGKALLGPKPLQGYLTAAGADGTLYSVNCSASPSTASVLTLHAYSSQLDEDWSLDLGAGCNMNAATLAGDGVMYITRGTQGERIELVALQTRSPGLAKSPKPTSGGMNNRRTGWLSAP
ncbi:MAG: PQQ-like beta-propeller repeat protein [Deltaproteobacteria bacterium]|nr:PQQ-like beta-propeller repeat protein [Deltaproteobacteria bacterium]